MVNNPAGCLAAAAQFYYDQSDATTGCVGSFPVGRMTRFNDESGSTTLCYDRRGNVTRKMQITNGISLVLGMTYSNADRISGMTYPSGTTVAYGRDNQGRVTSVNINGAAFITSATYLPFGPVNVITFQNGKTLTKTYDQNFYYFLAPHPVQPAECSCCCQKTESSRALAS